MMFEGSNTLPEYPYLRDGIDVFLGKDNTVIFVFLSSRRRLQIRCHPGLVQLLTWMRGRTTTADLKRRFAEDYPDSGLSDTAVEDFLRYLQHKNIIVDERWFEDLNLPPDYQERMQRQLHFLMDFSDSSSTVARIQKQIMAAKVAIFGVGGVGGWIATELAMVGFTKFVLIDPDITDESDFARHAYADRYQEKQRKVELAANSLIRIDPRISVQTHSEALNFDTDLEDLLRDTSLIVNAADEPYIGYTSVKLSRFAVRHSLPLFVAGGFDAHLASFGEMIIPGKTPCADCYANYFRVSLADWNPVQHPVKDRSKGFGGLSAQSVISASAAALQILKYYINPELILGGKRTEFLIPDYSTYSFEVPRDPYCKICGD